MSSLTDYGRDLVGRAICGRNPALPTNVYAALGTGGSPATGVTGEPVGSGYTRQPVQFVGTGNQTNAVLLRFNFTAGVGTLSHIGLFDALQGGNPLTFSALATPASLPSPGQVTIPANSLIIAPA